MARRGRDGRNAQLPSRHAASRVHGHCCWMAQVDAVSRASSSAWCSLLQAVDQRVEVAFDDVRQVVQRQALDAMVGDAALREVVGADALAAVAAADLQLARLRLRCGGLARALSLRPASRFRRFIALSRLACWLRSVWLSTTIPLGTWVMRIADSVLLTCWPPAPQERKVSTFRSAGLISIGSPSAFDRDDRHGRGRGVDAALRFGFRHALHAVRAGFELQLRIRAAAFDARDDFLEAAVFARDWRIRLSTLPALALGIARVHAEQVAGEDRRLVAAGAGAHFQVDVAFVARVLRDQVRQQFGVELLPAVRWRRRFPPRPVRAVPGRRASLRRRRDRAWPALRRPARWRPAPAARTRARACGSARRRRSRRDRRAGVRVPRAVRPGLRVCGAG